MINGSFHRVSLLLLGLMGLLEGCAQGNGNIKNRDKDENGLNPQEVTMWFPHEGKNLRGVALVVHGLNLRPSKMNDLVHELQKKGIQVLRLSLLGHRGSLEEMRGVDHEKWLKGLQEAFYLVDEVSRERSVPLFLVGYSLGALLSLELLSGSETVQFERRILFAPALSFKWYSHFIKALYIFGPKFVVESWNPSDYRAEKGSSMGAYQALFTSQKNLLVSDLQKINRPTLVIMDPQDELVSYQGIKEIVEQRKLDQWKFLEVHNRQSTLKGKFHHLIIDQESLGKEQWEKLVERMGKFLSLP